MNRREFLAALPVAAGAFSRAEAGPAPARCAMGLVIHSYGIRSRRPLPPDFPSISQPLAFLEHAARVGAAGVQVRIPPAEPKELARLAERAERGRLHLEGIVSLPRDAKDVPRFTAELEAARRAGASVVRTVCLNGRRYETFDSAAAFDRFVQRSWASLRLAEPIARRTGVRLAVENHKDWRIDELLGILRKLDSEFVGVCLDTGNSIALLEDPHRVVEAYAPFTLTTHFKDMVVAEVDDGFLLSEVPLGSGFLDLPRIVAVLRKARPQVRFNLEMITRDPLRVPCLTERYWATLGSVPGRELAAALARIRRHRSRGDLPTVAGLGNAEQLRTEENNVRRSLDFARDRLGLR